MGLRWPQVVLEAMPWFGGVNNTTVFSRKAYYEKLIKITFRKEIFGRKDTPTPVWGSANFSDFCQTQIALQIENYKNAEVSLFENVINEGKCWLL